MKKIAISLLIVGFSTASFACRDLIGVYQCKDTVTVISKNIFGYQLTEGNDSPIKLKCSEDSLNYTASMKVDGVKIAAHTTISILRDGIHQTTIATLEGIPVYFERMDCQSIE